MIPADEAIGQIKDAIKKTYGKKGGEKVIAQNNKAVDGALAALHEVKHPDKVTSKLHMLPAVPAHAPKFVKDVLGMMIANRGDDLPVSALPCDGTFPTATTQMKNAASPKTSRSGTRRFARSAGCVRWVAPTPRSA